MKEVKEHFLSFQPSLNGDNLCQISDIASRKIIEHSMLGDVEEFFKLEELQGYDIENASALPNFWLRQLKLVPKLKDRITQKDE